MLLATKQYFSEKHNLEDLKRYCKLGIEVDIALQITHQAQVVFHGP